MAAESWTTMVNDGRDHPPGYLLLRFGSDGLCLALREYWHIPPGRVDPPPGWGDLPG